MLSSRSRSRYLHNGYHCCKKAKNLKMELDAHRGRICSITILLRTFQRVQDIATNINQNRRLLLLVRFAWTSRNSPRSRACHSGPSASCRKLHISRVAGQENIICRVSSRTSQSVHQPLPGPFHLATSTPEGRWSRRSCHTKILILRGSGAFHKWEAQLRSGPRKRAL
jgi:hypothetical protein